MSYVILRVLSDQVHFLIDSLDLFRIGFCVVGKIDLRSEANMLRAPVEITQVHRTVDCPGNEMVAGLPSFCRLAGAFRSYGEMELSFLLHSRDYALDERSRVFPVGRYATHLTEYGTERPEEKLFLYHALGLDPKLSVI